jgi:hypothetical protein
MTTAELTEKGNRERHMGVEPSNPFRSVLRWRVIT